MCVCFKKKEDLIVLHPPLPACPPEIYTGASGIISSPNYPANYPREENCTYLITVEEGMAVLINFTDFDIEDGAFCEYDNLTVCLLLLIVFKKA